MYSSTLIFWTVWDRHSLDNWKVQVNEGIFHSICYQIIILSPKYTVCKMQNAGCIQSWKTWKSHGISFSFSRPGKVMEFDSRFWKNHKSHGNYKVASCETVWFGSSVKSCTSTQGYWYVQHENRNRCNLFITFCLKWLQIIHDMPCLVM